MPEHSTEGPEASASSDAGAASKPDLLRLSPSGTLRPADVLKLQRRAGNRAVCRLIDARRPTPGGGRARLQRRARGIRSNRTRTFTYELKLYTVDAESYALAKEAGDTLNTVTHTVWDNQAQADFTVRFAVKVFAPPAPEVLERDLGVELHYRAGRKRLRPHRYQEAAQRWWLETLRQPGDTGNLFLGHNPPSEDTKQFLRELAANAAGSSKAVIEVEFKRRFDAATTPAAKEAARDYYREEMHKLATNDPAKLVQQRFDHPVTGSRGTTFANVVVVLSGRGGTAEYKQSTRIHELMHLLGLGFDHQEYEPSVMSYSYLQHNPDKVVTPLPGDIDALVYDYNEPDSRSID